MTVKIEINNAEGIHKALNLQFKSKYTNKGYEYQTDFPKKTGKLTLKSFDLNKGFNFNILRGVISKLIQLETKQCYGNQIF